MTHPVNKNEKFWINLVHRILVNYQYLEIESHPLQDIRDQSQLLAVNFTLLLEWVSNSKTESPTTTGE